MVVAVVVVRGEAEACVGSGLTDNAWRHHVITGQDIPTVSIATLWMFSSNLQVSSALYWKEVDMEVR
jgi:hypothetical protein